MRLDGHLAQSQGERLLVYFGCPRAHEDDARSAVLTGLGDGRAPPGPWGGASSPTAGGGRHRVPGRAASFAYTSGALNHDGSQPLMPMVPTGGGASRARSSA
jgi:hypothetical protein